MNAHKIVLFSVVIILITVLFAGAVTVPAAAQYDTMQFRYNAQQTGDYSPVARTSQPNGLLKWSFETGSAAIKNQNITLQRSLNNSSWVTIAGHANMTNASGGYQLTTNETATGTYYYRGYYAGTSSYAAATSKGGDGGSDITRKVLEGPLRKNQACSLSR